MAFLGRRWRVLVLDLDVDPGLGHVESLDPSPSPAGYKRPGSEAECVQEPGQERFVPLDATADEARDVSALLSGARVLTGIQATESALKQLRGPSILHVATHGFFLQKPAQEKPIAGDQHGPAVRQVLQPGYPEAEDHPQQSRGCPTGDRQRDGVALGVVRAVSHP